MLECQVSAQDFSAAIGMLTDTQLIKTVIALCTLYIPGHIYANMYF